jgi:hypothetical protein
MGKISTVIIKIIKTTLLYNRMWELVNKKFSRKVDVGNLEWRWKIK